MIQGVIIRRNEKLVTLRGNGLSTYSLLFLAVNPRGTSLVVILYLRGKKSVSLKLDRIASITELGFELDTSMSEN